MNPYLGFGSFSEDTEVTGDDTVQRLATWLHSHYYGCRPVCQGPESHMATARIEVHDPLFAPKAVTEADEGTIRQVIVDWLGPQRMSLYLNRDIDNMVKGVVMYHAALSEPRP